jgi:hypothetical protein
VKKNKIITSLICAVLFCFCLVAVVNAIEALEFHMEGVVADNGSLRVYCNTNAEAVPRAEQFSATLGNTPLSVQDVTVFSEADEGTTFLFLVDVSGSIRSAHYQAIKDIINLICDDLTDKDNVSIFAFGTETYAQPFVSDPEDIQDQFDFLDSIDRSVEYTSLYEGVFTALSVLNTHADVNDKKVLIIFSDGHEYVFHGITVDEAEIRIRDSRVPIYTVATLGRNPPGRYVESAKILGSFARLSAGGRHYVHDLDRAVSEEIAADIMESIKNSLIVSVGLDGFQSDGEDLMLRLDLDLPGVGRASDGYPISTAGLTMPEPEPSPEPELTPEPGPEPIHVPTDPPVSEPGPGSEEEKSFFMENRLWIIIGGAVLLLAIGFILFKVLRKKPDEAPAVQPDPEPLPPIPVTTDSAVLPTPPAPPPGKPRISLRLTKIGFVEEQVFRTEFAGELIIGRDPDKSSLPFVDDEMLSGRHCSISYEPDGIVLRDLGSTNKTYVNGVPITDKYVLENDDILLIGSMELRINWVTL